MPNSKNVSEISNLQRGSDLDPYQVLGIPVRSFKMANGEYQAGLIDEEVEAYYPNRPFIEYGDIVLIPAMLWLIQEMHGEIQELKRKVK